MIRILEGRSPTRPVHVDRIVSANGLELPDSRVKGHCVIRVQRLISAGEIAEQPREASLLQYTVLPVLRRGQPVASWEVVRIGILLVERLLGVAIAEIDGLDRALFGVLPLAP